jgi:hypothetical protein
VAFTLEVAMLVIAVSMLVLLGAPPMSSNRRSEETLGKQFSDALVSTSRSPDIREDEDIYAPLEGRWDVETRDVLNDGSVVTGRGEWVFSRVLEGRAFQDVWILPARPGKGARPAHPANRYGTSVRTMNPKTRQWQVTWFNPVSGAFDVLQARVETGHIIQEGRRPDGQRIRWVFDVLTPDRFHWYGESERPDGSWGREAEFSGRRSASSK